MLTPNECGRRCRMTFADYYKPQHGLFRFRNRKIIFNDITVYSLYSDFHPRSSGWWYGVPKDEWDDWGNQSLVLLMKEGNEVNFVLLNPNEAIALLNKCKAVGNDEKKINIRRPTTAGKTYIIEWSQFPLENRMCPLKVSFDR
jgi:hypothetical protein